MFTYLLKIVFAFSIVMPFSINAFQRGAFSLKNNIGIFPNSLGESHENEDRMFVHENMEEIKSYDFIAGVLDGHSGEDVVNFISSSILRKFDQFFRCKDDFTEDKFKELYQDLEREIKVQRLTDGSTAIVACGKDDDLWLINLGDSKAVFYQNGEIFATKEHKPDFKTSEFDRILSAGGGVTIEYEFTYASPYRRYILNRDFRSSFSGGYKEKFADVCELDGRSIFRNDSYAHNRIIGSIDNPDKATISNFKIISKDCRVWNQQTRRTLGMSRSFGDLEFKHLGVCVIPDVYHYKIQKGTKSFVILASDGLWDALNEAQVCQIVMEQLADPFNKNTQEISQFLCERAKNTYREYDDISVILVLFDKSDFGN